MNEILIEQCSYLIDDTLPNIANISNLIALLGSSTVVKS